jgi:pimeloyl-ACP methyl ester carboxylesterase
MAIEVEKSIPAGVSRNGDQRTPDTVVFIHGLWMTPRSWEKWAARYESSGYNVLAPAWPGLEGEVEALRRDPGPLKQLDVAKLVDHYATIIRGLASPPILVGHSLGGTVVQLLLDRGLGAAGVGVASAAVKGIRDLPLSTIRATSPVLRNPFGRGGASPLNRKQFRYAFANTMTHEAADALYDRYYIPAANRVLFEIAFANLSRKSPVTVDFRNAARAPLLLIAFSEDHVVPPKTIQHNATKYEPGALTAFKQFPGRPHFPAAGGWEEVADYALAWATENARARTVGATA